MSCITVFFLLICRQVCQFHCVFALYAMNPLTQKKRGMRNDMKRLLMKVGVLNSKLVISTWENTTSIMVSPRSASMYSILFVGCCVVGVIMNNRLIFCKGKEISAMCQTSESEAEMIRILNH